MSQRVISLPQEHGGYLTVAGGAIAAVAVSPRPLVALAAAVAIGAAFFARGPLEKLAFGRRSARWDRAALAGFSVVAVLAGTYVAVGSESTTRAAPTLVAALAILGGSYAARMRRGHRSSGFELAGMAALGAGAGLMLFAGGAGLRTAAAAATVIGVHAAVAVPLVRSELRPVERAQAASADRTTFVLLACGAALLVGLGVPRAVLAFLPRLLQLLARRFGPPTVMRPAQVGLRETASLAAAVALLIFTLR